MADSPKISDFCRNRLEDGFRSIKKRVEDSVPADDGLVLDCGCGTGMLASLIPASRYIGIDVADRLITAARIRSPNHQFFEMNAKSLSFDAHTFSFVFIVGLLHHLTDEESSDVCSEIRRVLKPSGELLVLEDVSSRSRWNILGRMVHALDVGSHIRERSGYRRLLDESFEVLSMDHLASGVMDYAVFHCKPREPMKTTTSPHRPLRNELVPWAATSAALR